MALNSSSMNKQHIPLPPIYSPLTKKTQQRNLHRNKKKLSNNTKLLDSLSAANHELQSIMAAIQYVRGLHYPFNEPLYPTHQTNDHLVRYTLFRRAIL